MWNRKYGINELIYETKADTHRHREQTGGCQGGGMEWKAGVNRCKLYIEWTNNKVLLYSTGNYI